MPRSKLMDAIQATTTDTPTPEAKPGRKRPGPAPKVDQDGKRVLKSRATRSADLATEAEKRAAAEALNRDVAAWVAEAEEVKAIVLARDPGLEGDELHQAISTEESRRHAALYSSQPTAAERAAPQTAPLADAQAQLEVTRNEHPVYYDILSPEFIGRSVSEVPEAAPAGTLPAAIETTYRIVGAHDEYVLQSLGAGGRWVEERRGAELAHLSLHFSFRKVSAPEFYTLAAALPRYHPGHTAKLARFEAIRKEQAKPAPSREDKFYAGKIEIPRRAVMAGAPTPPGGDTGSWLDTY